MVTVNTIPRQTDHRRGNAVAISVRDKNGRHSSRVRDAIILPAIVMLATIVATHAFAAGPAGGPRGGHMRGAVHGPVIGQAPSSSPTFNPMYSHTVPQSPEIPVSPASPGSVFGN